MTRYLVATQNVDKATEITQILQESFGFELFSTPVDVSGATVGWLISDYPDSDSDLEASAHGAPVVEETAQTLLGNALIKAKGVFDEFGVPTISDDTGLFVDLLGGRPGVFSARFSGPDATYDENVTKLLEKLEGAPLGLRSAHFETVAVAYFGGGDYLESRGTVAGGIALERTCKNGFGYDCVFCPGGSDGMSFGEMTTTRKAAISHRGIALRGLADKLKEREARHGSN